MKTYLIRFTKLIVGLILYSLGIATTINANIGLAPWDVFHSGLAEAMNFSIGTAIITASIAIGIFDILMGEKFGLGTLLNMLLIGYFLDFILKVGFLPIQEIFFIGAIQMIIGLFIIALGSYFYIGSGFGAGPRDSLMIILRRKTNLKVGICRGAVELTAALVGWQLGGALGLGTLLSASTVSLCIQLTFQVLKFDPTAIEHENLADTVSNIMKQNPSPYDQEL